MGKGRRLKAVLFGLSILVIGTAVAATVPDSSRVWLPVIANGELILKVSAEQKSYPVLSNRISKIRGKIRSANARWLSGWLERRIYELPAGWSSEGAFHFLRGELSRVGATMLFSCSGRDCGESNLWANDIFAIPTLYGRDREQHYLLAQRSDRSGYYLIYTVTRGTNRAYVMTDFFVQEAP